MNYTEQLQTLPKEDATQVIFDVMNARAIEALEAMKNEVSEGNFYRMGDMINGSMPWDSAKLPKDTSKHSYTRYSNDVPVEVKPHNGQDRVWNYKTNEMMSIGKPQKSWDGKRNLTPYTGKLVGSEVSEGTTDGAYSDKHPKIDLFHNGVYIASTNWSSTVKHAVAKAKEKRPELTGKMTGKISVRESIAESINVAEFYQNSIDESIKKVGEFTAGRHKATIHKDSDLQEYKVKFHVDGKHHEPADHFTDDKDDAFGTAKHQVENMHSKDQEANK